MVGLHIYVSLLEGKSTCLFSSTFTCKQPWMPPVGNRSSHGVSGCRGWNVPCCHLPSNAGRSKTDARFAWLATSKMGDLTTQVMDQNCNFSWESGCKKILGKKIIHWFFEFSKNFGQTLMSFNQHSASYSNRVANQTGIDQRHVEAHKTICKGKWSVTTVSI